MIVENLRGHIFKASGLQIDSRWKRWAKFVDSVDETKANGYCFVGDFVPSGTVEIKAEKPRVILVAAESGSRKYRTYSYAVVILNTDGTVEPTEIGTSGDQKGWALRIRDQVKALVDQCAGVEQLDPKANAHGLIDMLEAIPVLAEKDKYITILNALRIVIDEQL